MNIESKKIFVLELENGVPNELKDQIPESANTKFGIIANKENASKIIVVKKSFNNLQELYIFNNFDDSLKFIKTDGKLEFKEVIDVNIRIPDLQKNKNTPVSIIRFGMLTPEIMVYRFMDFRSGFVTINNQKYFIGLINHQMDYSTKLETTFFIDIDKNGKFSDIDSLDSQGILIKEKYEDLLQKTQLEIKGVNNE